MSRSDDKRSRRRLLLLLLAMPLLVVAAWSALTGWSRFRLHRARADFEARHGTLGETLPGVTETGPNEVARRLDAAARRLGYRLTVGGPPADWSLRPPAAMRDHLVRVLEAPEPPRPPPEVARWLDDHLGEVEAVVAAATGPVPPRWSSEPGPDGRLPPLAAHYQLQRLLVAGALEDVRTGELGRADRRLEAAWRLVSSLETEPVLTQRILWLGSVHWLAAAVRRHPDAADPWIERLSGLDPAERVAEALRAHALVLGELPEREAARLSREVELGGVGTLAWWPRGALRLGRPRSDGALPWWPRGTPRGVGTALAAVARPAFRSGSAADIEELDAALSRWEAARPCAADPAEREESWWPSASRVGWSPAGGGSGVSLLRDSSATHFLAKAAAVRAQVDLTLAVLEARLLVAAARPEEARIDVVEGSCPDWRWERRIEPDGSIALRFVGERPWTDPRSRPPSLDHLEE